MKRFLLLPFLLLVGCSAVNANDYYNATGNPTQGSSLSSSLMRTEFSLVEAGDDKLPDLTGKNSLVIRVNAGATGLEAVTNSDDLLDGSDASALHTHVSLYQPLDSTLTSVAGGGANVTGANLDTLTGAGDASALHTHTYLPLAGGTMTGDIVVGTNDIKRDGTGYPALQVGSAEIDLQVAANDYVRANDTNLIADWDTLTSSHGLLIRESGVTKGSLTVNDEGTIALSSSGDANKGVYIYDTDDDYFAITNNGSTNAIFDFASEPASGYNVYLRFLVNSSDKGHLTCDSSGNVTLQGDGNTSIYSGTNDYLNVTSDGLVFNDDDLSTGKGLKMYDSAVIKGYLKTASDGDVTLWGGGDVNIIADGADVRLTSADTADYFELDENGAIVSLDALSGAVGYKIAEGGSTKATFASDTTGNARLYAYGGDVLIGAGDDLLPETDGGCNLGSVAKTWNYLYTVNPAHAPSDARLKKNIKPIKDISWLYEIDPVSFKWKDKEKGTEVHLGFTAQDINAKIPSENWMLSTKELKPDSDPDSPDYNYNVAVTELISPLVKAVQNHKKEIDTLKVENISLKARLDAMEARLTALEAR